MTRPRRNILLCLLAAVLCLSAIVAFAQDVFLRPALEDFIDKDTKLVFPAIVETFQKVRVRKNENPVFGTVVRYENESGTCADVYIYSLDTGAKEVSPDDFEKHFQETDQGILKLAEQNARIKAVSRLETPERLVRFCQGIQMASPVDAMALPEPWDMPGYADQVVMAAGTFVPGASIELSADGPMRAPYTAYMQGALTYAHGRLAME